jgi:putative addiction module killer protein
VQIYETGAFKKWYNKLRDLRAQALIQDRIKRLKEGNRGDWKPVGEGLIEMRIRYGPGYRIYCKDTGKELIILLCGSDKSNQQSAIDQAKQIALNPFEEDNDGIE